MASRTIELDLKFLLAVLNWAAKSRDEEGRLLLDSNPLRGLKTPKEKNPTRVVLCEDEYQAMLGVSRQVDWRFHVAFVLAHETGHRIGAIRNLRWGDIDFEGREVRWRAEHEKTGYEHITPMTDEAAAILEEARGMGAGIDVPSGRLSPRPAPGSVPADFAKARPRSRRLRTRRGCASGRRGMEWA